MSAPWSAFSTIFVTGIVDVIGVVTLPAPHLVGAVVVHEGVVTIAAAQEVIAPGAVQDVVAAIAGKYVGFPVAGAVEVIIAAKEQALQMLAVIAHCEIDGGENRIGVAFTGKLGPPRRRHCRHSRYRHRPRLPCGRHHTRR